MDLLPPEGSMIKHKGKGYLVSHYKFEIHLGKAGINLGMSKVDGGMYLKFNRGRK